MNKQVENFINTIHNKHLLEKYKLEKISLFGSFARGDEYKDIDIYLEENNYSERIIEFKKELENIFHKPVDIMLKKYANPIVLHRASREFIDVTRH